jgi:hypothetical protein
MKWWLRLLPISPLEGEMPGRAEGGEAPRTSCSQTMHTQNPHHARYFLKNSVVLPQARSAAALS